MRIELKTTHAEIQRARKAEFESNTDHATALERTAEMGGQAEVDSRNCLSELPGCAVRSRARLLTAATDNDAAILEPVAESTSGLRALA